MNRKLVHSDTDVIALIAEAGDEDLAAEVLNIEFALTDGTFVGNRRGYASAALQKITVDVEVFCRGVGFRKFRCTDLPVDGWCFVATAQWNGQQCTAVSPVHLNSLPTETPNNIMEKNTANRHEVPDADSQLSV